MITPKSLVSFVGKVYGQRGHTTIFSFNPRTMQLGQMVHQKNQIMDDITKCGASLFGGNIAYKAGALYFEYENLAYETDDPTPPVFNKSEGVEYYTGLQYDVNRDFLRVPILVHPNVTETTEGHLLTLYAITPDEDSGFWGKPFDAVNNSAVYGGAVAVTPDPPNLSSDLIIARNYPTGAKVLKAPGEQIAMVWNIEFLKPEDGS